MREYAGSEWIQKSLFYGQDLQMSEIGKNVADLLGQLERGIYHMDPKALKRVDWTNPHHIEIVTDMQGFATTDFDGLTRLVFLAHQMAIRVQIEAATHRYFRLIFHQRTRNVEGEYKHPTLDQAVATFKVEMVHAGIQEYQDPEKAVIVGQTRDGMPIKEGEYL